MDWPRRAAVASALAISAGCGKDPSLTRSGAVRRDAGSPPAPDAGGSVRRGPCDGNEVDCWGASCSDLVRNGDESDTDCGGACAPCPQDSRCNSPADCASSVCGPGGSCSQPSCSDLVRNGDESDTDCGGACAPCPQDSRCNSPADCASSVCGPGGSCSQPSCSDLVRNGDESDTDCGGACTPCPQDSRCNSPADCASSVCGPGGSCSQPSCSDLVRNGDESDTDCGGACTPCPQDSRCNSPADCASSVCGPGGSCSQPSCSDLVRNGDESDTDCGGACAPCPQDSRCNSPPDCASSVCGPGGSCSQPSCSDLVRNGDESDTDCGGACAPCPQDSRCNSPPDCASSVCGPGGSCSQPSCSDLVRNGDESDTDCGGACAPCPQDSRCNSPPDCASSVCGPGGSCSQPSCSDLVRNGDESDTDCGGACAPCPQDSRCNSPPDCASSVCGPGGSCSQPSCSDLVRNGDESDTDCGGACAPCPLGARCAANADCSSGGCQAGQCAEGPTAGFSLEPNRGFLPLSVSVSSSASAGDASIRQVEYAFGDGSGLTLQTTHTYEQTGVFTVTQRVTDESGLVAETTRTVNVEGEFSPVRFSATDKSPAPGARVSSNGIELELAPKDLGSAGARSETAIAPGSGFFYFEGERLSEPYDFSFGVVTAAFELKAVAGSDAQSAGVSTEGEITAGASSVGGFPPESAAHYGFAIDYRAANPVVHVIVGSAVTSAPLSAVTEPVFLYAGGLRSRVGPQARINAGNDTENFPFFYEPTSILENAGVASAGLVLGFGQTNAVAPSSPPSLSIAGGGVTVALGQQVTLTATATDAEDGPLSAAVVWGDLSASPAWRDTAVGAQWSFEPDALGIHPIEATVTDSTGLSARASVDVEVTGALPQHDPVVLTPDPLSGEGIELSADGLSARFNALDKYGIRANQGLLGGFQYFEIRRLAATPFNTGGGLTIARSNLNPHAPADVGPAFALNHSEGIWRNLVSVGGYEAANTEFYGFAVDYRGRHPHVRVITQTAAGAATVSADLELEDVTVPVFPYVYGDPTGSGTAFDVAINFGASPFHYSPASVLTAAGIDPSGLQLRWGPASPL